jgi:vacuolar-type H+-ATPase subunit C/Vma6
MNKLSFERLLNSESLEETSQLLKGTIYYESIDKLLNDKSETAYFNFERRLDYEYIKEVNSFNEGLRGENAKIVGLLTGEYEDLLILKSIFRIKKYFSNGKIKLNRQEKIKGLKIKEADIKILSDAKDSDEFLKLSEKYKFKKIYIKSIKNNSSIEKEIDIYMKKLYTAQKKNNSNTIGVIIAYFELLMYEIKNIIMILEGKKYGIRADIAGRYII